MVNILDGITIPLNINDNRSIVYKKSEHPYCIMQYGLGAAVFPFL